MTHRVFKLTDKAIENGYDWDTAIAEGEIETVEEFDSYTDAVDAILTLNVATITTSVYKEPYPVFVEMDY